MKVLMHYVKVNQDSREGWSHMIKIHDSQYKWIDAWDFLGISLLRKRVYWRRLVPDDQVQHNRVLGVEIDENVSWNKHIENVVN
jgi:hypothetical protein